MVTSIKVMQANRKLEYFVRVTVHQMAEINSFRKESILRDRKLQGMNITLSSVSGICRADNTASNPFPRVGKKNTLFPKF